MSDIITGRTGAGTMSTLRELLEDFYALDFENYPRWSLSLSDLDRAEAELTKPLRDEIAALRDKAAKGKVLARSVNDALGDLPDAEYLIATTLAVALADYHADHDAAGPPAVADAGETGADEPVYDAPTNEELDHNLVDVFVALDVHEDQLAALRRDVDMLTERLEAQAAPVEVSDAAVRAALDTWNSIESKCYTHYTDAQMAQMRRTMEAVLRGAGEG